MADWNQSNTVLIMASTGFQYEGTCSEGYKVFHPYKGKGLFQRILRELCFRLPLLPKKPWYEKAVTKEQPEHIFVWDTLITTDYLRWLAERFPGARIYYIYGNLVGRARHLVPRQVPEGVSIWTYDESDSEKYGIGLYRTHAYFPCFLRPKQEPEYDVFFVGRDKGRGEELLALEKKLREMGLRTRFIITADGRFSRKKAYYQAPIAYREVLDYLSRSKAVLNVAMDNQQGVTLRDTESMFFNIKLITTNRHIVRADFYQPENVFILGQRELEELPRFLSEAPRPADPALLERMTMKCQLDEITAGWERGLPNR